VVYKLLQNKKVYPQVYLVNWLSNGETQSEAVCSHLSSSLTNFEVHCAEGTMSALAVARCVRPQPTPRSRNCCVCYRC
jgi:hypothetical protein